MAQIWSHPGSWKVLILQLKTYCSKLQIPGRLGLLVTIDLIATNVYNSVKAPIKRGFSFIELWCVGTQIPVLCAIAEYGLILVMMKFWPESKGELWVIRGKKITYNMFDLFSFIVSLIYLVIFNIFYWMTA